MFLEFNWTANVYQPRFGDRFTDIRGVRSYETLADAKWHLETCKLQLGRKTDTMTWEIISAD
jgi:hypothetical protein